MYEEMGTFITGIVKAAVQKKHPEKFIPLEIKVEEKSEAKLDLKPDITMYDVKDVQDIFKCSPTQAYSIVNANGFPSIRLGGKIMVERSAMINWLDKNKGKKVAI